MAIATVNYSTATPVTVTITLASLASSTSLNSGRESAVILSTTYLAVDYLIGGSIMTSTTAPTANRSIEVWAYGSWNGTTFSGGCTGADAALTFASEKTLLQLLQVINTDATASHSYEFGPCSIAQAFGGVPPIEWGVWVGQNTGQALNANSSNHSIQFTPVFFQSS